MPALWPIISAALAFFVREILVKFLILAGLMAAMSFLMPFVFQQLAPFLNINLNSLFTAVPPTVWFFADAMQLDYGLPLIISAYVARFLIKRLPIVG